MGRRALPHVLFQRLLCSCQALTPRTQGEPCSPFTRPTAGLYLWSASCGRYSTLFSQKSGLPRLYLMSLETHPFKGYLLALGLPGTNLPWVDYGMSSVGDQVRAHGLPG